MLYFSQSSWPSNHQIIYCVLEHTAKLPEAVYEDGMGTFDIRNLRQREAEVYSRENLQLQKIFNVSLKTGYFNRMRTTVTKDSCFERKETRHNLTLKSELQRRLQSVDNQLITVRYISSDKAV